MAAQEALKGPERAKRRALDTLKAWMRQRGTEKEAIEGRTVSLVQSKRYSVDYRSSTPCWNRRPGPKSSPSTTPSTCG